MKKILSLLGALCTAVLPLSGAETPLTEKDFRLGEIDYAGVKIQATYKDGVFTVVVPKVSGMSNETRGADLIIPKERLEGKGVQIRGEFRWEGVDREPGNPHSGAKILIVPEKNGVMSFAGTTAVLGTQKEWQQMSATCEFPANMDKHRIVFGIQQGWGKYEFRNLFIEEFPVAPISTVKVPEGFKQEYTDRVTKDVRRRGVMSPGWGHTICEKDIEDLASWNVNLIRYQIVDGIDDPTDEEKYDKWFTSQLDRLESLMPLMKKYDIKAIIDMHSVAGGRYGKNDKELDGAHFRAFHEQKYLDFFIRCWEKTAKRFKGNELVYAFDLCNEPIQHGAVPCSFWEMQYKAAQAIRAIDPEVPIMVESNHMANPTFFEMAPMPLKNIIYSVHMYSPGNFVFQGIEDPKYSEEYATRAIPYSKTGWNRTKLADAMKSVREFELKYGAKIEVGEFSVINWAPGGADYLNELVSVYEEYGWDWTYHAFREWPGWSLEHVGLPNNIIPADKDTDRKIVMLKYFGLNKKAAQK